ncbi:ACT domain-containing protein [Peptococcaceae bacterium 1198_IL3148]
MELKLIEKSFSICKVIDLSKVNFNDEYVFLAKTDEEISLVCQTKYVPGNCVECEKGWSAFRINGELDFSLIGILSKISKILADNKIGIFVVSTYNTDYIFVKEDNLTSAIEVLTAAGYRFI